MLDAIRALLAAHGQPPVYLTLDIDCLDPAFAPGTGTPEPGGLTTNQVLTLLEELSDLPFVGMDCVEVAPPYDHAELTSNAAATFVWTYLCGRIARRRSSRARTPDSPVHNKARKAKAPSSGRRSRRAGAGRVSDGSSSAAVNARTSPSRL